METVDLLRSPPHAAHLQRSLEQAEHGELLAHPLIDADPLDAAELGDQPVAADQGGAALPEPIEG